MRKLLHFLIPSFTFFLGILVYPLIYNVSKTSLSNKNLPQEKTRYIKKTTVVNFSKNWQTQMGIPVLCYHQVVTQKEYKRRPTPFAVTITQFRQQVQWLKKNQYYTLSIEQFYKYMTGKNQIPLNKKLVLITFDDGLNDFTKHAQKILEKVSYKAVLFVYPTWILAKKKRALKPWQMAKLVKNGFNIESHTFWHPKLTTMNIKDQSYQFRQSRKYLKKWTLQKSISYLAYPFGLFNETSITLLKKLKYKAGFTIFPGINIPGQNPYAFLRYMVVHSDNLKRFQQKLEKRSIPIFESKPNFGATIPNTGKEIRLTIPAQLEKKYLSLTYKRKKLKFSYSNKTGIVKFFFKLRKGKNHNLNIKYQENGTTYRQTLLFNSLKNT